MNAKNKQSMQVCKSVQKCDVAQFIKCAQCVSLIHCTLYTLFCRVYFPESVQR